ncbi:MAG TPA: hypothetical protein VJ346_03860 [Bacteroidales bacterium]|nr:hypothetical protein [Bacteroidales bacterium]
MKKTFVLGQLVLGLAIILSSCGKLPQADIDAANVAVDSAKIAGAEVYIADEFMAITDSLKSAMEKIEAQKSKSMFRNYGEASKQLQDVKTLAEQAKENAIIKKNQVKEEVQNILNEMSTLVTENKELIAKAPKGKEGKAALDEMKNELAVIETTITETVTLFENGDYMTAMEKITAAKEKALSINNELKEAIAKYKKR